MNGLRCTLEEAAAILDKTPAALRRLFQRERCRTGAAEVRLNGVRAIRRGRHCWIVTFGGPWLVAGRAATWSRLDAAARALSVPRATLRRSLERYQRSTREGLTSSYKGLEARKLGARWLLRLAGTSNNARGRAKETAA
jgi:hypothetical protein